MKALFSKIVLCSLFIGLTAHAAETTKVGYLDLQRAIQSTTAGKNAKKDLDVEFNKRKVTLDKKKAEIEKVGQDLEKKRTVLSEEVFAKKQGDLQQEMMQFQKSVNDSQTEMQKLQANLLQPILDKMQKSVEKVAANKGYAMILEKSERNVVFAAKDLDVTDDVVKDFEASSATK